MLKSTRQNNVSARTHRHTRNGKGHAHRSHLIRQQGQRHHNVRGRKDNRTSPTQGSNGSYSLYYVEEDRRLSPSSDARVTSFD